MNLVIPMAGLGKRFQEAGYKVPKMLIEARGKTLLEWSIDSLPLNLCSNLVCIMLKEHEEQYQLSAFIQKIYGKRLPIRTYYLESVTNGQAETVFRAKDLLLPQEELLIFNIDTCFYSSTLERDLLQHNHDGILGAFSSKENRFSYAAVNDKGFVTRTAEKEVISSHALTGLYHFKLVNDFLETAAYHFENNIRYKNEFYIAPMYNYLIEKGRQFRVNECEQHHILGTPEELQLFLNHPL